jgi:hypothetical protein
VVYVRKLSVSNGSPALEFTVPPAFDTVVGRLPGIIASVVSYYELFSIFLALIAPDSHLRSREDLEDLLNDPNYFQAIVHSLPRVKAMFQAQSELGSANESIARRFWTLMMESC